jgi:hypothetical protein
MQISFAARAAELSMYPWLMAVCTIKGRYALHIHNLNLLKAVCILRIATVSHRQSIVRLRYKKLKMLKTIFSLDYEIHGNGEGDPYKLMVEPTDRMLDLFDLYGAKLTIMADVAEILKFKEYYEKTQKDVFSYKLIVGQLISAVKRGHDVQLHLHSSYFNAFYNTVKWQQHWQEYDFAGLPPERMDFMVQTGKNFLENLLKPIKPDYQCIAFRSANWSTFPSENLIRILEKNQIPIETSVFKFGKRNGMVNFDYTQAWSAIYPWPVSEKNICFRKENGSVFEFPIYCVQKSPLSFLTPERIKRIITAGKHSFAKDSEFANLNTGKKVTPGKYKLFDSLFKKYPWKADFNQCTGSQLIKEISKVFKHCGSDKKDIPFVLIGHSKLFSKSNEKILSPFLKFITKNPDSFGYSLYGDFDFNTFQKCQEFCSL